jgi:hypothetical protein
MNPLCSTECISDVTASAELYPAHVFSSSAGKQIAVGSIHVIFLRVGMWLIFLPTVTVRKPAIAGVW